jgi:hypothetical protein
MPEKCFLVHRIRYILQNMALPTEAFAPMLGGSTCPESEGRLRTLLGRWVCLHRGCLTGNRRGGAVRGFVSARRGAEEKTMKLSARNQLKGKVIEVTKGATTSHDL